jgi:hypothetical protein
MVRIAIVILLLLELLLNVNSLANRSDNGIATDDAPEHWARPCTTPIAADVAIGEDNSTLRLDLLVLDVLRDTAR